VIGSQAKTGSPLHPTSPTRFAPIGTRAVTLLQPELPADLACSDWCNRHTAHCINGVDIATVCEALAAPSRDRSR
jgi:hypothetical protein